MDSLYICWSYHHIFCAVERVLANKEKASIVIVFRDGNPRQDIFEKLKGTDIFTEVYSFYEQNYLWPVSKKRIIKYSLNRYYAVKNDLDYAFPVDIFSFDEIFTFYDSSIVGAYLNVKKRPYHIIEDAKTCFTTEVLKRTEPSIRKLIYEPSLLIKILKKFGYIIPIFGESKYCIDIEVDSETGIYKTSHNENKFVMIPLESYEKKLSENEVDMIIDLFSSDMKIDISKKYRLLLTEPLKVDGRLQSYREQKIVYKSIIDDLERESSDFLLIKPHPRDTFDYRKVFNSSRIFTLDKTFPSEVISLIANDCIEHYYTITSSAIYSFPESKCTVLGNEYLNKVLNDA